MESRRFQMRLDEAGLSGVPAGVVEVSFEQAVPEPLRRAVLEGLDDHNRIVTFPRSLS